MPNAVPESATEFLSHVDRKVARLLAEIEGSEVYRVMVDTDTPRSLLVAVVRNILLETGSYGPHITTATCTAIGRMADRHRFIRPLMSHLLEEVSHPDLALRGYARLGGDESLARARRISPQAFAAAAVARTLAEAESPFSYLGYMYLTEGTTAVVAARVNAAMKAKQVSVEFVDVHAQADVEHAGFLREQIGQVVAEYPEEAAAIEYGFDCYAAVYPHPIWAAALERARREMA